MPRDFVSGIGLPDQEENAWDDKTLQTEQGEICKLRQFNPQAEFPLHELRADVDDLIIDFSESMFVCFEPKKPYESLANRLREHQSQFTDMLNRSEACLARLEELALFRLGLGLGLGLGLNDKNREIMLSIKRFLHTQLELCALQCAIFLVAARSKLREDEMFARWRRAEVWERVQGHDTVIAKISALVARCVWGATGDAKLAVSELEALPNGELLPYDEPKHSFLKQFASDVVKRIWVAVGTEVTPCPPHRSLRAAFPHKAPASGE